MTNLSLMPTVEVELPVDLSASLLERDMDLPEKVLRERAARYILAGSDSLTLEVSVKIPENNACCPTSTFSGGSRESPLHRI